MTKRNVSVDSIAADPETVELLETRERAAPSPSPALLERVAAREKKEHHKVRRVVKPGPELMCACCHGPCTSDVR